MPHLYIGEGDEGVTAGPVPAHPAGRKGKPLGPRGALMSAKMEHNEIRGEFGAAGLRFGIVVSRFNSFITERLLAGAVERSEEHTSELQSHSDLVCRLLLE